jgi:Na+/H+ antiporter NhaD/arsenite permease-like protein
MSLRQSGNVTAMLSSGPVLARLTNHAAILGRFAREQTLELGAAALAATFLLTGRVTPRAAVAAIDFDLLFVLFALLVTVEILRESGLVDRLVAGAVRRFRSTRAFAAVLIALSGTLAASMTNDVALFVVIPFTVVAGRLTNFDVEDAVVLEIVAANLLGCLTPLGNPQNLFIFHQSGWSVVRFVTVMAPFAGWCAIGLAAALPLLFRSKKIVPAGDSLPPARRSLAWIGTACFVLVSLEVARVIPAWPAAVAALLAGVICLRRGFFDIDLSIVPLFFFAFIAVEGLRTFDVYALLHANVYVLGVVVSQVISNVPAAILLSPLAGDDWRPLLYGVNAGGCGTLIASLANLLGWRIYVREYGRDPRFLWRLLAINFAFLAWAALGGWVLLSL